MKPSLLAAMLAIPLLAPPQAGAQSIPAHEMQRVDGFEIDRHEVTIGQFRRFAEAFEARADLVYGRRREAAPPAPSAPPAV